MFSSRNWQMILRIFGFNFFIMDLCGICFFYSILWIIIFLYLYFNYICSWLMMALTGVMNNRHLNFIFLDTPTISSPIFSPITLRKKEKAVVYVKLQVSSEMYLFYLFIIIFIFPFQSLWLVFIFPCRSAAKQKVGPGSDMNSRSSPLFYLLKKVIFYILECILWTHKLV